MAKEERLHISRENAYFRSVVFLLTIAFLPAYVFTQTTRRQSEQPDQKDRAKLLQSTVSVTRPILDATLDPDKYYVGPSDVFAVNIWAAEPIFLSVTVSPEGTLVIPTVGEVRVANVTLGEARKKVISEIRKKYLGGEPTVTLLQPRDIYVSVSGNVKQPGRYEVSASDRIEKALQNANKVITQVGDIIKQSYEKIEWPGTASKRNISVRRRDGAVVRVDLQKFHATGDDTWNPYLREGDEIYVPRSDLAKNFIAVYGGVNEPGAIEFVQGDNLLDAIKLAGGLTKRAIGDSVILSRFSPPSLSETVVGLSDQRGSGTLLEAGDRILVKEKFEPREDFTITIEGEVVYPGVYPITKDRTHLSEIIRQAIVTAYASLKSAELIRLPLGQSDPNVERMLKNRGNINPEDEAYLNQETELRLQGERVSVDFAKLLQQNDSTQDVILRPGDRIVIPRSPKAVYVFGQVLSPTQVSYMSGKPLSYYISEGGGYTDQAETSGIKVIKHSTRQWVNPADTEIEEGDLVWVPKTPYRPFTYYLGIISQTASIITGALTIVLLVLQLQK